MDDIDPRLLGQYLMRSESTEHEKNMRWLPAEHSWLEWLLYPREVESADRRRADTMKELRKSSSNPKDPTVY